MALREDPILAAPLPADYDWMSVAQWHAKHEAYAAEAARGEAEAVFYGDSITEVLPQSEAWKKRHRSPQSAAFGISGDRTAQMRWRIENGECGNLKPKNAYLLIGTNNFGHFNHSAQEAASGVIAAALALRSRLPQARLTIFSIFPAGQLPSNPLRAKIRTANALIHALDDRRLTRVVDLEKIFLASDGSIPASLMADFLHPTEAGYEAWMSAVDSLK